MGFSSAGRGGGDGKLLGGTVGTRGGSANIRLLEEIFSESCWLIVASLSIDRPNSE